MKPDPNYREPAPAPPVRVVDELEPLHPFVEFTAPCPACGGSTYSWRYIDCTDQRRLNTAVPCDDQRPHLHLWCEIGCGTQLATEPIRRRRAEDATTEAARVPRVSRHARVRPRRRVALPLEAPLAVIFAPWDMVEVRQLDEVHHLQHLSGRTGTVDRVEGAFVDVWVAGARRSFVPSELRLIASTRPRGGFEFL